MKFSIKNFASNCRILFLHSYFSSLQLSESSSFGRARPCQGRGGRFEPGLSLQKPEFRFGFFFKSFNRRLGGGTGRHAGLKILFAATRVRVRFPPGALSLRLREGIFFAILWLNSNPCLSVNNEMNQIALIVALLW